MISHTVCFFSTVFHILLGFFGGVLKLILLMNAKKKLTPFLMNLWAIMGIFVVMTLKQWRSEEGRKEIVLFNDALNTFYLRLYGIRHIVKDHFR